MIELMATDVIGDKEHKDICEGKLCPECLASEDEIKLIASNYDGFNLNNVFECKTFGYKWEGF